MSAPEPERIDGDPSADEEAEAPREPAGASPDPGLVDEAKAWFDAGRERGTGTVALSPEEQAALLADADLPPGPFEAVAGRRSPAPDPGSGRYVARPRATDRLEAARIETYEVVRELARGASAAVYEARCGELGRRVAIKVLLAGEQASGEARERLQVEARAAARLKHRNIVGIHYVGQKGGLPYLVMDLVEGETLHDRLRRDGPLPPREAARIAERIARALAYAHRRAILHRDVKPANVLIDAEGEPVLTDFGIAKDIGERGLTVSGQVMGTPAYMPPEQAEGRLEAVDRRADVYALGATLYEMLTGRPPFDDASVMKVIARVVSEEPARPSSRRPGIDRDIETICLRCLEKEPARRFASAGDLAEDLARYGRDEPIEARRPNLRERAHKWLRRNRALAQALAVVLAVGVVLGVSGAAWAFQVLKTGRERAEREAARARASAAETRRLLGHALEEKGARAAAEGRVDEAAVLLASALAIEDLPSRRARAAEAVASSWPARLRRAGAGSLRVAWAPAGDAVAAGGDGGALRLWGPDLAPGRELAADGAPVRAVAWAPDGERVACGRADGLVEVFDRAGEARALPGHIGAVTDVAWSPDGERFASASRDGTVRVWATAGEGAVGLSHQAAAVLDVAWAPDGRLASATEDGLVRLWSPAGDLQATLRGHGGAVRALAWAPDGARLASGSEDRTVRLWDGGGGAAHVLTGHEHAVLAVAWSPDGSLLASGAADRRVRVWDGAGAADGAVATLEGHADPVERVAWSPDGRWLASAGRGGAVRVWAPRRRRRPVRAVLAAHRRGGPPAPIADLAWSPAGDLLLAGDADGVLRTWAPTDEPVVVAHEHAAEVHAVAWSPDGVLASAAGDGALRVGSGAAAEVLDLHERAVRDLAWGPAGDRLASASDDGTAALTAPGGGPPVALGGHSNAVHAVAWSPDGRLLASGSADTTLRLWRAADGALERAVDAPTARVRGVAWSPDGTRIALALGDEASGRVVVVTASDGAVERELPARDAAVLAVAWDPSGERLAAAGADGALHVHRPDGGLAWSAPRRSGPLRTLAWSPDGAHLAAAGDEGAVELWTAAGAALVHLPLDAGDVLDLAWSPAGDRLAIGCADFTARVWNLAGLRAPPEDLLAEATARTGLRLAGLRPIPAERP